ncbi:hypothetical protein ACEWY4_008515 [Coilia grayii]|uniref:Endonuclease/exonuclease/phosphatase domain-containing protein n=1 Tax=Coilia grayii TaxID=363190 RepID=A0ABD1KB38_9TELE
MAAALRVPAKEHRRPCYEYGDGPGDQDSPEWENIRIELKQIAVELQDKQGSDDVDAVEWEDIVEVLHEMAQGEGPGSDEASSDDWTNDNDLSARMRLVHLHDRLSKKKKPLLSEEQTDDENKKVKVGLLNVRSLNNKSEPICALITERALEVFLLTETWLNSRNADDLLRAACPPNFCFYHQDRAVGRGGGVANLFSEEFQHALIRGCAEKTFECLAVHLQHADWNRPVLCINVYRPPGGSLRTFLEFYNAFVRVFQDISSDYACILMTGDFNLHFEKANRISNIIFKIFLMRFGLVQHVMEPTHQSGHTLDLVLTRNVEISDLSIENDRISDHYTAYFRSRPKVSIERQALMRFAGTMRRYLERFQ